ncbi:MAG: serine/threonine protein kinase [Ktedonobacteraceae bacterium]
MEQFERKLPRGHLLKNKRYCVTDTLGSGSYGYVYLAEDRKFGNKRRAIKQLIRDKLGRGVFATDRFEDEARNLAKLSHPNLPGVIDYFAEAGDNFIIMEFIAGVTLEDALARSKGHFLPVRDVIEIGIQLSDVFAYLHSQEPPIIYRDVKPDNIMRTPEGKVYLIDFGLTRKFKESESKDTSQRRGNRFTMSPEVFLMTGQASERSDIYSLGVTLYYLLSGGGRKGLHYGWNIPKGHEREAFEFPSLDLHGQSEPKGLRELISNMVEFKTEDRPKSMYEVKRRLVQIRNENFIKSATSTPKKDSNGDRQRRANPTKHSNFNDFFESLFKSRLNHPPQQFPKTEHIPTAPQKTRLVDVLFSIVAIAGPVSFVLMFIFAILGLVIPVLFAGIVMFVCLIIVIFIIMKFDI